MATTMISAAVVRMESDFAAATAHLSSLRKSLEEIKRRPMWPAVPTEVWFGRYGRNTKYLELLFHKNNDGTYQGPDGIRRVYIGIDPERIADARKRTETRKLYEQLVTDIENLEKYLEDRKQEIVMFSMSTQNWPRGRVKALWTDTGQISTSDGHKGTPL